MWPSRKLELLTPLIAGLCEERGIQVPAPTGVDEMWEQFRALVNTRPPTPASPQWLDLQDQLLSELIAGDGVVSIDEAEVAPLHPNIRLWQGDITRLAVGAIVNAANQRMLGCFVPLHNCIDNCIHSAAGVQLREECAKGVEALLRSGTYSSPVAVPLLTKGYNLPAEHVIHVVGPAVGGRTPTEASRKDLRACYVNVLDLCAEKDIDSVAFCCISTGVFGYPAQEAAQIAVRTVTEWLNKHKDKKIKVLFNVFTDTDADIYKQIFRGRTNL